MKRKLEAQRGLLRMIIIRNDVKLTANLVHRAQATNPLYINDPLRVRNPYADRVPPVNIGRSDLDPFYVDPLGGGGKSY